MSRNQGFISDKLTLDLQPLPTTDTKEVPPGHCFECVLRCGEEEGGGMEEGGVREVREVRVTCTGRKDGQVVAAQAMLKVRKASSQFSISPSLTR